MNELLLSDEQLNRYSRHLLLPEIDLAGQARLSSARVLVIGAGGLGSPAAMYLASSGVGKITIFDHDEVDLGNLQRQIAFRTSDIGAPKAERLRQTLLELNPEIEVEAFCQRAEGSILSQAVAAADVVIDACDNFDSRFAINQACFASATPLVSGAAIRLQGQVTVFDPRQQASPCYRCLYREDATLPQESCRDRGVFAPLVGIIGSIQAAEALKLLLGLGQPLTGRLLLLDALTMTPRLINLPRDPDCPVCARRSKT
jgi:adenylyltransferase/sulfurtransferase